MSLSQRVAFIGAGNMAGALIEGLLNAGTCTADGIVASDVLPEALARVATRFGIHTTSDNAVAVRGAQIVVLSTKPQGFAELLPALATCLEPNTLVISIAAGVPLSVIEGQCKPGLRAVRAMPNTPALVQAGATAISAGRFATSADLDVAAEIFSSVGVVERVPEALLDAVTGLSGSGPAYVFLMIEALTNAGVQIGLSTKTAAVLAAQTVFGAAKLERQTGESPEALRHKVTSPGGTTAAGLARLNARDFTGIVAEAVAAATERAHELGAEAALKLSKRG